MIHSRADRESRLDGSDSPVSEQDRRTPIEPELAQESVPLYTSSTGETDRDRVVEAAAPGNNRFGTMVRVGFGLIWLVDALLKWQPAFQRHFMDIVGDGAKDQPVWLAPWFHFWQSVLAPHAALCALCAALIETGIALALIFGFARKLTYIGGALWSLGIWAVPEGFGHDDISMSTDIGTAIIYAVVFLAFLALDQSFGTRPYSLDAALETRLPWWRQVAEIRGSEVGARRFA